MVIEWPHFLVPDIYPNTVQIVALSDPLPSVFQLLRAGGPHWTSASGNPQRLVLCIIDVSVVCVAYVSTPNRCSIVDDQSPNCLVCYQ